MLDWLLGRKKLKDSEIVYKVREGRKEYVYMDEGVMEEVWVDPVVEKQRESAVNHIREVKTVKSNYPQVNIGKSTSRAGISSSNSSRSDDSFMAAAVYSSYDSGSSYSSCDSGSSSSSCD